MTWHFADETHTIVQCLFDKTRDVSHNEADDLPIHLTTQNRRRFLQAAGASILLYGHGVLASETGDVDADLVYLLNDTHIGEKQPEDSAVPAHLRQVVTELVNRPTKPACVLINGDLALKDGQPGDYRHFAKLIAPLQKAGVDTHLTLGNHDHRDAFYQILKEQLPEKPPVESRHIAVVETQHANLFLLDSLQKTMVARLVTRAGSLMSKKKRQSTG